MPGGLSGRALTVLGAVDAASMGVTLPHEHLLIDFAVMFKEPAAASDKGLAYQPVTLSTRSCCSGARAARRSSTRPT